MGDTSSRPEISRFSSTYQLSLYYYPRRQRNVLSGPILSRLIYNPIIFSLYKKLLLSPSIIARKSQSSLRKSYTLEEKQRRAIYYCPPQHLEAQRRVPHQRRKKNEASRHVSARVTAALVCVCVPADDIIANKRAFEL